MNEKSMERTLNILTRIDSCIHDLNRAIGRDNNVIGCADKQLEQAKGAFLDIYAHKVNNKSELSIFDDNGSLTLSKSTLKKVVDKAKEYHPGDNVMIDEVLANVYDACFKHKNEKNRKQWLEVAYEAFANDYKPGLIYNT